MARAEVYLHAKFSLDPSNRLDNTPMSQIGQTDRTDRTDRQRTDSIGRTVLQTVAQKHESGESRRAPVESDGGERANRRADGDAL